MNPGSDELSRKDTCTLAYKSVAKAVASEDGLVLNKWFEV